MRRNLKTGQSILEYTLLLGAVIAVIVFVLLKSGGIKSKVEDAYDKTGQALENTTTDLTGGIFQ
jgi:Flp pilus assembly pilin Flp